MTTEMTHLQEADALSRFKSKTKEFSEKDLKKAIEDSQQKIEKLEKRIPDSMVTLWNWVKLMFRALRNYANGSYRQMPWATVAAIAAALLYFISPVDAIVDVIPALGYLDDAMVIGFGLKLISGDLKKYSAWEDTQKKASELEGQSA